MAKQLDEQAIINELHGGSAFFRPTPAEEVIPQPVTVKKTEGMQGEANKESVRRRKAADNKTLNQRIDQLTAPSTRRLPSQPVNQSGDPSTSAIIDPLNNQVVDPFAGELTSHTFDRSPILPRPKSFYITEKQDEDLDTLVKKLAERVKGRTEQKIDRSVATRLIFESIDLLGDDTVDRLARQLTSRLASQLTGQLDNL